MGQTLHIGLIVRNEVGYLFVGYRRNRVVSGDANRTVLTHSKATRFLSRGLSVLNTVFGVEMGTVRFASR